MLAAIRRFDLLKNCTEKKTKERFLTKIKFNFETMVKIMN